MRRNVWKKILVYSGKAALLGAILFTLFPVQPALVQAQSTGYTPTISDFNATFGTPDSYSNCRSRGGTWDLINSRCLTSDPLSTTELPIGARDKSADYCNSLGSCLANVVYLFTVGLGSAAAFLGAWVFSFATALTLNSTAYALSFLTQGWGIVRDLANMFFILILVYIALTVMFRADTSETMRRLAWVVAIALVINFSFFFVRVVIDAGNVLAVQFYNAIEAPPIGNTILNSGLTGSAASFIAGTSSVGPGATTKDLTASIMNGIGVQKILSTKSFEKFQEENNWLTELIALSFIYIALGVILFILAAAFFTVGIKFIVRTAVLWLTIIASPLAFIAYTVKQGEKYFRMWLDTLILHAFYPAVFLFIFYVLVLFMNQLTNGGTGTILSQTFDEVNTVQIDGLAYLVPLIAIITIKLGFVIALLFLGLSAANRMGVMGAQLAGNATGLVSRATGYAGRRTIGWAGRRIERSPTVAAGARRDRPSLQRFLWRRTEGVGRRLGAASFDLRNTPLARRGLEQMAGASVATGKPSGEGGYTKMAQEKTEKREKERKERAAIIRDAANKKAIQEAIQNANEGLPVPSDTKDRIKNFSKREMGELKAADVEAIAHIITEAQLKAEMESDKRTDEEKERIRNTFNEKNPAAPLQKANAILKKLNDIDSHLTGAAKFGQTMQGTLINKANVSTSLQVVKDKIQEITAERDAIPRSDKAARIAHNHILERLQDARKEVEKLDEERKKVPANIGGTSNSEEFRADVT